MKLVSMRKLLENGVHYGHHTRRWNPKAKSFIYTSKRGIHIIDLEKTLESLDVAYNKIKNVSENGGKVLFVGTKGHCQQTIVDEATRSGSFYINQRWLGGTLTNFKTIQKRIKRLLEIEEMEASETISVYTKKEQALIRKEGARLNNFLGGIKDIKKLPDAIVVVDPTEDKNAVLEAKKLNIPVIALCDTNCDPEFIDYPIYSNDDALKPVKLMMSLLADAIVESKGGLLQEAYQEGEIEDDVTMSDVIVNVEKHAEEQDKKRKALQAENRKAKFEKANRRFSTEKRTFSKKEETNEEVNQQESVKVEENVEVKEEN